jgi:hypothetical protein
MNSILLAFFGLIGSSETHQRSLHSISSGLAGQNSGFSAKSRSGEAADLRRAVFWGIAAVVTVVIGPCPLPAQLSPAQLSLPKPTEWRTGHSLNQQLQQPISAAWAAVPFRSRLISFANQQRVAIFVDRRLDPATPTSLSLRNVTVEQFLWAIAEQHDWGVCRLDDFYYLGPAETAAALPILWGDLVRETRRQTRRFKIDWNAPIEIELPEFSNPADMLSQISAEHQFNISGVGLPHDRWAATSLPASSMDKVVALYAVGFGKWIERSANGTTLELIHFPMPESGTVEFEPPGNARELLADLRTRFPDCRLSSTAKTFRVTGAPFQIAAVRTQMVAAQRPLRVAGSDDERFTLTTRARRGDILATVAQQTHSELTLDPVFNDVMKQFIELSVNQVSLSELLEKTLEGTGASYQVDDGKIEILKSASN